MELSKLSSEKRIFLFSDCITFFFCLFFAGCSFASAKNGNVNIFSLSIDRGILTGFFFIILAAIIPVVALTLNRCKSNIVQWFRIFYVQLYFGFFFSQSIIISNRIFKGNSFDHIFAAADGALFGLQPAIQFSRVLPQSPLIVELFFFSYFFFYILISIGIWILYLRGKTKESLSFLSYLTLGFYLLYAFYIFFPVKGPKYYFQELNTLWYSNFDGYIFTWFLKGVFNRMTLSGGAFPSSHATISVLALMLNFKYQKVCGYIFLPFTLLLLFSTVYIYAHYAVDIIAGIVLGALYFAILPPMQSAIDKLFLNMEKRVFSY
jgi:membrane-associated phospholipid phosphatase